MALKLLPDEVPKAIVQVGQSLELESKSPKTELGIRLPLAQTENFNSLARGLLTQVKTGEKAVKEPGLEEQNEQPEDADSNSKSGE